MEDLIDYIYPGKVLLFGEYTVIDGGDSLAIPLYKKTANWDYDELEFESRESLDQFVDFLMLNGMVDFDLDLFSSEWEAGLFLESNIPSGYGAGSSGAVVAALYDCFVHAKKDDIHELRAIFQKMESYFHGTSSGIDPLVSYVGKGILIEKEEIHVQDVDHNLILNNLYLWDSGIPRKTNPLVQWYKTQMKSTSFKNLIFNTLFPLNEALIKSFIIEDQVSFLENLKLLEDFQIQFLKKMFPLEIKEKLYQLKKEYNATIKLCGAGGGGYYLIYCEDERIRDEVSIIPFL